MLLFTKVAVAFLSHERPTSLEVWISGNNQTEKQTYFTAVFIFSRSPSSGSRICLGQSQIWRPTMGVPSLYLTTLSRASKPAKLLLLCFTRATALNRTCAKKKPWLTQHPKPLNPISLVFRAPPVHPKPEPSTLKPRPTSAPARVSKDLRNLNATVRVWV